ncbi:MAG: NAD-dependent epimerase/dehydratase family protein [Proteobacteria bacterium]|nr:NAD-dependent epimerase/dehydratase family protein [Pseudomonadota bacterium]
MSVSSSRQLLITGGAGFIGSHTARAARSAGWAVRILDNLSTGSLDALDSLDVDFHRGDIRSDRDVDRAMKGVTHVVHLAARISVPESCEDPVGYDQVNVAGTVRVMQAARLAGCTAMVFASSAAVYGSDPKVPKTVTDRPQPESPYASQKLANEAYANAFASISPLRTIGLRYFNVFGPGQDPNGPYGAVIPSFVQAAVQGRDLTVHGDGLQTRDFVSVHDVAQANIAALQGPSGVYNVGTGHGLSVKALADLVLSEVQSSSKLIHGPERLGDVRHSLSDIQHTTAALDWLPAQDFNRALTETIRYFRQRSERKG